jgi:hypothetical protein
VSELEVSRIHQASRLALAFGGLTEAQREALLLGATLKDGRRELVAALLAKRWPLSDDQAES